MDIKAERQRIQERIDAESNCERKCHLVISPNKTDDERRLCDDIACLDRYIRNMDTPIPDYVDHAAEPWRRMRELVDAINHALDRLGWD